MGLEFRCRHRYAGGFALDLDFRADRDATALFGPSGSGKTSALEMIAGLRRPDAGRIAVGGRVLFDSAAGIDVKPEARGVGIVFQDQLLFPHISVERNLRFGERRGRGKIPFARLVEVLELGPLLARAPRRLSGGERQRVALGRALLSGPELLLLDEPLAALDEALKLRVLAYVERAIREWKIPTLFVSHSQAEVRRLAQWAIVIDGGKIAGEGEPADALGAPGPLGLKDGVGPMNVLRIEELKIEGDRRRGRIGQQWISLPGVSHTATGESEARFIEFAPEAVILAPRDLTGVSARNHLTAKVLRTVDVAGAVFVEMDAGQRLWGVVTPEAARELNLTAGAEVFCLIKTQSLRLAE